MKKAKELQKTTRRKNLKLIMFELIKKSWEKIKDSIRTTVKFLECIGINNKSSLRSNNAIIPIIYYVYKKEMKEIDTTKKDFVILRKYIYSVLLNGVFGGQTDAILTDSRNIVNEKLKEDIFPLSELFKAFSLKNKTIRKEEELMELLEEIKYNTDRSRLILNIIYKNNLPCEFQEDHMFPRSKMIKKHSKKEVDNIANLQPLGSFTNNSKNNKKFKEWLEEPNRSEEYREVNLIPKIEDYSDDNFEEFLKKRRKLIFDAVKGFFN